MARGHGRILTSIWEDADFLMLSQEQQRLYLFLISQPNLNHAGLLPLTLRRWARKAAGLDVDVLLGHLLHLDETDFIVMDEDTEEVLIRSFVRNDGVWKQPRVMGAMTSGALEITSWRLRYALLREVDRIPLDELSDAPGAKGAPSIRAQVVDHIVALRKGFGDGPPEPPRTRFASPSEGGSEGASGTPSASSSETLDEGDPQGSTRVGASPRARALPLPLPLSPTPTPATSAPAAPEVAPCEPVTAQTLVAEWIDHCDKQPPGKVIGHTARILKELLDEGHHPQDVRRALASWARKGLHPSTLPSELNAVMNAGSNVIRLPTGHQIPTTGTDATVAGWLDLPTEGA